MKTTLFPLCALAAATLLASCGADKTDYDATGVFEATEVVVSAQTQGELTRMLPREGEPVEAGSLIAAVDTVQLALKRDQLVASLGAVGSRRYDVARQVAAIRQQIATQARERERFAQLVAKQAGNQKQVDDIDAQIAFLQKQLDAQTETLGNTNSSVDSELRSLEAQIAQIDDQIRRSAILSPLTGTVLARYAEPGELATAGKPLYKLADVGTLYLRAYVTAPQLTRLKLGQTVRVFADSGEDGRKEYKGRISWIADEAEFTPKTIQTRDERANLVYAVKIEVKNDGLIKSGMYGECKF